MFWFHHTWGMVLWHYILIALVKWHRKSSSQSYAAFFIKHTQTIFKMQMFQGRHLFGILSTYMWLLSSSNIIGLSNLKYFTLINIEHLEQMYTVLLVNTSYCFITFTRFACPNRFSKKYCRKERLKWRQMWNYMNKTQGRAEEHNQ